MGEALDGFVIEVEVAYLQGWGQTVGVQGVAVVLGGDVDASGDEVFDGVVCASMTELELEGLAPEGFAEHLITQAYPHYRLDADEGTHRIGDLA